MLRKTLNEFFSKLYFANWPETSNFYQFTNFIETVLLTIASKLHYLEKYIRTLCFVVNFFCYKQFVI